MSDLRAKLEYAYNRFHKAASEVECVRRYVRDGGKDVDLPKRTATALAELKSSKEQVFRYMEQLEKEIGGLDNCAATG